jgi:hypothetical protein
MSQVFHGVVVRISEPEARALFATLDSRLPLLPLRLVRLDDDVFGIYVRRRADEPCELRRISAQLARIPGELQRIAAQLSHAAGAALLYWYDSRVGGWCQLFEHGRMARELRPDDPPDSWGKGDPLAAIGARRSLDKVVEEAFLYDTLEPLAVKRPEWAGAEPHRSETRRGRSS